MKNGNKIFNQLFLLNKENLLQTLKILLKSNEQYEEVLNKDDVKIRKVLIENQPEEIDVYSFFHSSLVINNQGIFYKPENGLLIRVMEFNNFVDIDKVLNRL